MTFTEHHIEQRTPEWHALRCGRLCGSKASDMLATIKTGEAAARRNLRVQLALERITGKGQERSTFVSQAMQDGITREIDAVALYDATTGNCARSTGFGAVNEVLAGCAPDGVIGDFDGLLEVKSPLAATHLEFLKSGTIPKDYIDQITHNLWVTGAQWCDYLSYQPDFPEPLRTRLVRVRRAALDIAAYETAAFKFLAEVDFEVLEFGKLLPVAVPA